MYTAMATDSFIYGTNMNDALTNVASADAVNQDMYHHLLGLDVCSVDKIDAVLETPMEHSQPKAPLMVPDGRPIVTQSVKYHRDRDFLTKYGWVRMIDQKTSKIIYCQSGGRWPNQPSVKAARRAMRDFFDQRRKIRRTDSPLARKRCHDEVEQVRLKDDLRSKPTKQYFATTAPALPVGMPLHPFTSSVPIATVYSEDEASIFDAYGQTDLKNVSAQSSHPMSAAPSLTPLTGGRPRRTGSPNGVSR